MESRDPRTARPEGCPECDGVVDHARECSNNVGTIDVVDGGDDLPTIEYVTESGVRRQESYERVPGLPWRAQLVEREEDEDGEFRMVGGQMLSELKIDGEHVAAKVGSFPGP